MEAEGGKASWRIQISSCSVCLCLGVIQDDRWSLSGLLLYLIFHKECISKLLLLSARTKALISSFSLILASCYLSPPHVQIQSGVQSSVAKSKSNAGWKKVSKKRRRKTKVWLNWDHSAEVMQIWYFLLHCETEIHSVRVIVLNLLSVWFVWREWES